MIYARILLSFWNHLVVLATIANSLPTRIPIGECLSSVSASSYFLTGLFNERLTSECEDVWLYWSLMLSVLGAKMAVSCQLFRSRMVRGKGRFCRYYVVQVTLGNCTF